MSLRSELVAMLEELEHFAYDGAPLYTAIEKVREILAKTEPKVLTTVDELNSEEARRALCLVSTDGEELVSYYDRINGQTHWARFGSDYFFSSAELLDHGKRPAPGFVMVEAVPENLVPVGPKVLTTLEDLNSEEAFTALCIMPYGGPLRAPSGRIDGVNYWQEPEHEGEYSSGELLAHFMKIGAEPAFTLIKG